MFATLSMSSFSLHHAVPRAVEAPCLEPGDGEGTPFYHLPVLGREVVEVLKPGPGQHFLDATLGGGGHAEMLLEAGASVTGMDQDAEALAHATARLARFGVAFQPVKANFREAARHFGAGTLDVSSRQLDESARGFSFQREGPLDMRMDQTVTLTAADVVNTTDEAELTRLFFTLGEEPKSRHIAREIVRQREHQPFATTLELAAAVERVKPRRGRSHPATQIFQALRIAVNGELEALQALLDAAPALLKPGGRLAIITFHSLEDRLVKQTFKARSAAWLDDPTWPAAKANPQCCFKAVTRKAVEASAHELAANPRSRSARLRCVEKIASPA